MSTHNKVISFEKLSKRNHYSQPIFSKGLYNWVMFVISFYSRVKNILKIDFDTFVILQVVVSHSLYEINKSGLKTYEELENEINKIAGKQPVNNQNKLTFASIAGVLNLPRETVRRKVLLLNKKNILFFNSSGGIKLGPEYKKIYKDFVKETTLDLSKLIKKWKKTGALDKLLELKEEINNG